MSEQLKLNSGIEAYQIDNGTENGAVLKVNFSDTNLYFRFLEMQDSFEEIEKEFQRKIAAFKDKANKADTSSTEAGREMIDFMREFDIKIKGKLTEVFGSDNDFDSIFAGVNAMSLDENGNSIISNFLEMLTPVIARSLEALKQFDTAAVTALVGNRAERRTRNTQ